MQLPITQSYINKLKSMINDSEILIITAGAGMGVDSGLPDFRGKEGFWRAYPIFKRLNINMENIANPKSFKTNPSLAWAFYGHRHSLYQDTKTHKGFDLLLNLAKQKEDYFIITSNIDGHFQKAGFNTNRIYECHGNLYTLQCTNKKCKTLWCLNERIEVDMETFSTKTFPKCPKCGKTARPNILMFFDYDFNPTITEYQYALYKHFIDKNKHKKATIIEIGAGKTIPTIRALGESLATRMKKSHFIRINPMDYDVSKYIANMYSLNMGGLAGLEVLLGE